MTCSMPGLGIILIAMNPAMPQVATNCDCLSYWIQSAALVFGTQHDPYYGELLSLALRLRTEPMVSSYCTHFEDMRLGMIDLQKRKDP